jgi:hypothetical protein
MLVSHINVQLCFQRLSINIPRCDQTFHYFETYHSTLPFFKRVSSVTGLFVGNFTCQVEWKTDSEPLQQIYTVNVGLIKVYSNKNQNLSLLVGDKPLKTN